MTCAQRLRRHPSFEVLAWSSSRVLCFRTRHLPGSHLLSCEAARVDQRGVKALGHERGWPNALPESRAPLILPARHVLEETGANSPSSSSTSSAAVQ
eukprot:scaffold117977_cov30-Tisochrysis_lutea.AAC.2